MKAITILPGEKRSLRVRDIKKPTPGKDELLLKTRYVGIDGTDKELVGGEYGESPSETPYLITGHECIATVTKSGTTERFEKGDLIVPTVRRGDNCVNCQAGEYDLCIQGDYTERGIKGSHGYLTEYFTEQPQHLIKIPSALGDEAVLLEPTSIAQKAIRTAYEVRSHQRWEPSLAVVTGGGTLGILTAAYLRLRGLRVVITDLNADEYKQKLFKRIGARYVNAAEHELHDIPGMLGAQPDIIIEGTGVSSVAIHSMSVVGPNGVVILLSITPDQDNMNLCASCLNQGLVLGNKAVRGSVNAHKKDFLRGIEDLLATKQRWPNILSDLITATHTPNTFHQAIAALKDNIKIRIDFTRTETDT